MLSLDKNTSRRKNRRRTRWIRFFLCADSAPAIDEKNTGKKPWREIADIETVICAPIYSEVLGIKSPRKVDELNRAITYALQLN